MICEKCGAEYPDTEVKCPVCGVETEGLAEDTVAEETAEVIEISDAVAVKKSRKPLWIVLAAAAVVIAIAATVFAVASNLTFTGACL